MIAMMHDAYDDFIQHDYEHTEWLKNRPVCDVCGEPIQDDSYHTLFEKNICNRCLDDNIKFTED